MAGLSTLLDSVISARTGFNLARQPLVNGSTHLGACGGGSSMLSGSPQAGAFQPAAVHATSSAHRLEDGVDEIRM